MPLGLTGDGGTGLELGVMRVGVPQVFRVEKLVSEESRRAVLRSAALCNTLCQVTRQWG